MSAAGGEGQLVADDGVRPVGEVIRAMRILF
jgi:hypothetical protein